MKRKQKFCMMGKLHPLIKSSRIWRTRWRWKNQKPQARQYIPDSPVPICQFILERLVSMMHVNDCQADAVMIPVPVLPSVFFLCGSISLLGAINRYVRYIYICIVHIYNIYLPRIYTYIYMGQISVARFSCLTSACRSPSLIGRDDAVVKVTPCMFGFGGFCRLLEVSCFPEISYSWNSCRMLC